MKTLTTFMVVALGLGAAVGAAMLPGRALAQAGPSGHGGHTTTPRHTPDVCEREFEQVIADGRGFGMAFAADRHGYPGPLHVLELAGQLGLTADQETRVRALMDAMFAESRPKGALLLAAERRLTSLFASGRADADSVRAAVADVERLRGELRTLHLVTHLRTRDVLSESQRRAYHAARWGAH
jgi:Spy/CpxP family protein refolding chaperone